ncbi:MAG: galactose mutarotase [Rhodobacteraceae bacterium]|nr:galactose mutarotase [Paracoccaceae bacterium]
MQQDQFGRMPGGLPVERVTLAGGGLRASVLTYGAVLQDLRLDGHAPSLVLGFAEFSDYLTHSAYFGAIVGRCANRIGNARFELDGRTCHIDRNQPGGHHLHGGRLGMGQRLWSVIAKDAASVTLAITLEDGDMGYPGKMRATVRYALLEDATLDIRMAATSDRPTLCNLAHHSYFNLSGEADILGHHLRIAAEYYLPVDSDLIPTGTVAPVGGTGFDFRQGGRLGDHCKRVALDNNLCLSKTRQSLRDVAELSAGGIAMTVRTTEPGMQVFDGGALPVSAFGSDGRQFGAYCGIALEPQLWPDAIHHPDWQQPVLRPGETYRQHTQFAFTRSASRANRP